MTAMTQAQPRRIPWITLAILSAQVAMFAVAWTASGEHGLNLSAQDGIRWGGNIAYYTWDGQWWRVLTTKFLHLHAALLLLVVWAFWDAGRVVERIYGGLALLIVFFGAAVCTSLATLAFSPPNQMAIGGGGTTLAVLGALAGYAATVRSAEMLPLLRPLRFSAPVFFAYVAYQLYAGRIDLPSVSIGLLCGFLLGLCFAPRGDAPGASSPR